MELILIVVCGVFVLLQVVDLSRALLTGRIGFGEGAVTRAGNPDEFWPNTVLTALSIPVFSWLLYCLIQGDPPRPGEPDPTEIGFVAMLALLLVRFLIRGTASAGGTPFSRKEEPTQYWIIIALTVAALCLVAWMALGFPLLL
jgi:hypothetical protein